MRCFGWTPDYIRKGITGAQGWAYFAWALENEMSMFGSSVERKSDGYIKQEIKWLTAKSK